MGLTRWDHSFNSSLYSIARAFAAQHNVYYIDRPFTIRDLFIKGTVLGKQRWKAVFLGRDYIREVEDRGRRFWQVTPMLTLSVNFLPEGFLYQWFQAFNRRQVSRVISHLIADRNITRYIYFNGFLPHYFSVIPPRIPQPLLTVYRSSDDISQEPYIARHGVSAEKNAIQLADLVFASSYHLCEKLAKATNKPVHRVPNAADPGLFGPSVKPVEKPAILEHAKGNIFLFVGRADQLRIDFPLLRKICQAFPEDTLVVLGHLHQTAVEEFGLNAMPNFLHIPQRPATELKAFISRASITLIPFLKNELTSGIYPLKINEYLASGKPVVTTDFSEDLADFNDLIFLAESHESFLQMLKLALATDNEASQEKRIRFSHQHTWEHRVELMYAHFKSRLG